MDVISKEEALAVGVQVRYWRRLHGLQQRHLAAKTGIPVARISVIELGQATGWAKLITDVGRICDALGLRIHEVIKDAAPKPLTWSPTRRDATRVPVASIAPASPVDAFNQAPTKANLDAAIAHLRGLMPRAPSWADDQARAGLNEFVRHPRLREDAGEPGWFVEFQRRLAPHIEAEAAAMLGEIPT